MVHALSMKCTSNSSLRLAVQVGYWIVRAIGMTGNLDPELSLTHTRGTLAEAGARVPLRHKSPLLLWLFPFPSASLGHITQPHPG